MHYSQVFTTAAPFQSSVEIHVLQGERPMAKDNKTIGKFKLKGIKKAMAGVPKIEVTFDIDTNGILRVSAKDLGTGKEQSITIDNDERMSEDEIAAAIRDAEKYADEDNARRATAELRNQAQTLLTQAQAAYDAHKRDVEKTERHEVQADIAALQKALSKRPKKNDDGSTAIREAMERLNRSSAHMRSM